VFERTNDRSRAVSRGLRGEGDVGRALASARGLELVAADKFHLLIGGSYAGLAADVATLRRGSFELCFCERGVFLPD